MKTHRDPVGWFNTLPRIVKYSADIVFFRRSIEKKDAKLEEVTFPDLCKKKKRKRKKKKKEKKEKEKKEKKKKKKKIKKKRKERKKPCVCHCDNSLRSLSCV
jgi:hypothetical protein